jgi:orotidine-5'-phosphate decarboxylase
VQASVQAGQDVDGGGMVISSSRAILYADGSEAFAQHAAQVARSTRDEINRHRTRRA